MILGYKSLVRAAKSSSSSAAAIHSRTNVFIFPLQVFSIFLIPCKCAQFGRNVLKTLSLVWKRGKGLSGVIGFNDFWLFQMPARWEVLNPSMHRGKAGIATKPSLLNDLTIANWHLISKQTTTFIWNSFMKLRAYDDEYGCQNCEAPTCLRPSLLFCMIRRA